MEQLYKFLKILIVILLVAVVFAVCWRFWPGTETEIPAESTAAEETTEAPAAAAPDFTVYDIDGNAVTLSDFRGQPVVVNFWASWCGPCKAEMPDLEQAYLDYGDQVQFLIIDLTEGRSETVEMASEYIASQGYTFPVYYDTEQSAAQAYAITAIPMSCFIDARGTLVSSHVGTISAQELTENILSLLAVE